MKQTNKALTLIVVFALLGGLMFLNYKLKEEPAPPEPHAVSKTPGKAGDNLPPGYKLPGQTVAKVKIYLIRSRANTQGDLDFSLEPVERDLDAEMAKNPAQMAMNELCRGNLGMGDLEDAIPQNVKVLGVKIENGLATVDFSQELVRNFPGGSEWEALVVGSIVKTLTQFPEVRRVQILVEGNKIDSIGGHVEIDRPISRNEKLP